MKTIIVIPARFESTRYPGKPLVELRGATGQSTTLVERSWRAAKQVKGVDRVVIATDDVRIMEKAHEFGAEVVMTSKCCENGTERCAEVIKKLEKHYDIVVNFQGDAPLTPVWFVEELINAINQNPMYQVATPVLKCEPRMILDLIEDRQNGRVGGTTVVFDHAFSALYFSKEVIPYASEEDLRLGKVCVYHHVGVYVYSARALSQYANSKSGALERSEGLEQLRFLENNQKVLCVEVDAKGRQFWELNNPVDVKKLEIMMIEMGME